MEIVTIDDIPILAYNTWRGVDAAVNEILSELVERSYRAQLDLEDMDGVVYFCPVCTFVKITTYLAVKKNGVPKCPLHGVDMLRYDWGSYAKRRHELMDRVESKLRDILTVFEKAATAYAAKPPLEWRLRIPPVVELKPNDDPTVFRYISWDDAVDAVFYYMEMPRQKRAFEILLNDTLKLGLAFHALIYYTDEPPPGAVKDEESGVYVVYAKPGETPTKRKKYSKKR
jgi:hypothetical protein